MNNNQRHYATRRRVLVTGGAGFLGSHLCERLIADGCDVLCVDNFFTGTKDNIAHLVESPHFELMRHEPTIMIETRRDIPKVVTILTAAGYHVPNMQEMFGLAGSPDTSIALNSAPEGVQQRGRPV